MRWTADVRHVTGASRHWVLRPETGEVERLQPAVRVEIVQEKEGFFLIRYSAQGFAGDTWHPTLEEAKRGAEVEFAIPPQDWREGPEE